MDDELRHLLVVTHVCMCISSFDQNQHWLLCCLITCTCTYKYFSRWLLIDDRCQSNARARRRWWRAAERTPRLHRHQQHRGARAVTQQLVHGDAVRPVPRSRHVAYRRGDDDRHQSQERQRSVARGVAISVVAWLMSGWCYVVHVIVTRLAVVHVIIQTLSQESSRYVDSMFYWRDFRRCIYLQ